MRLSTHDPLFLHPPCHAVIPHNVSLSFSSVLLRQPFHPRLLSPRRCDSCAHVFTSTQCCMCVCLLIGSLASIYLASVCKHTYSTSPPAGLANIFSCRSERTPPACCLSLPVYSMSQLPSLLLSATKQAPQVPRLPAPWNVKWGTHFNSVEFGYISVLTYLQKAHGALQHLSRALALLSLSPSHGAAQIAQIVTWHNVLGLKRALGMISMFWGGYWAGDAVGSSPGVEGCSQRLGRMGGKREVWTRLCSFLLAPRGGGKATTQWKRLFWLCFLPLFSRDAGRICILIMFG